MGKVITGRKLDTYPGRTIVLPDDTHRLSGELTHIGKPGRIVEVGGWIGPDSVPQDAKWGVYDESFVLVGDTEPVTLTAPWTGDFPGGRNVESVITRQAPYVPPFEAWDPMVELGVKIKGWYRADTLPVLADATVFGTWPDSSGRGNTGSSTGAARPAYYNVLQGGLPTVYFNGTSWLYTNVSASSMDETVLGVFRIDTITAGVRTLLGPSYSILGSANDGRQLRTSGASPSLEYLRASLASLGSSANVIASGWHILGGTINPGIVYYHTNGATDSDVIAQTLGTGHVTQIGARFDGEGLFGCISELFICNTLTTAERQELEGYLAHKYLMTANLPADHPYKTTPPGVQPASIIYPGSIIVQPNDVIRVANATDGAARSAYIPETGGAALQRSDSDLTFNTGFPSSSALGSDLVLPWYVTVEENRAPTVAPTSPIAGEPVGTISPVLEFTVYDEDQVYGDSITNAIVRMYRKVAGSYRRIGDKSIAYSPPADPTTDPIAMSTTWDVMWTPVQLGGKLDAWFDASQVTGVADGADLNQWDDVSGNGHHAVAPTALRRPTYRATSIGGKPAIDFVRADDDEYATDLPVGVDALDQSVFYVVDLDDLTTHQFVVWGTTVNGIGVYHAITSGVTAIQGITTADIVYGASIAVNTPTIVGATVTLTSAEVRQNGNVTTAGHNTTFAGGNERRLGVDTDGQIPEFIFASNLTVLEKQLIEGYLAWKYGLTANLPTGHPYKTVMPTLTVGNAYAPTEWTPADIAGMTTFSPLNIPLKAWFKADAITGVANGAALAQWNDSSGQNYHATQGVGANQPIYRTAQINGLPAVDFVSTDFLSTSISASSMDEDVFVVASRDVAPADHVILGSTGTTSSGGRVFYINGNDLAIIKRGVAYLGTSTPNSVAATTTTLITERIRATSVVLGVNGTEVTTAHAQTFTASLTTMIGATDTTPALGFDGKIAEIIICPSLPFNDRKKVEGYLAWKYGIQASLPVGHPYKTVAPLGNRLGVWLDPSDSATLTLNVSKVATINDKSGNARHATNTTDAQRPTLQTASALRLARQSMAFVPTNFLTSTEWSSAHHSEHVFMVVRRFGIASQTIIGPAANGGRQYSHDTPGDLLSMSYYSVTTTGSSLQTIPYDTPVIVHGHINPTTWLAGVNGLATPSYARTIQFVGSGTLIGATPALSQQFDGNLGEIFAIHNPTQDEIDKALAYLAYRWGTIATLSTVNPYRDDYSDEAIYAWTIEVLDEIGGDTGTGYGGRDLTTELPDGTTEFILNDLGYVTHTTPTGKITTITPSPWRGTYSHPSARATAKIQLRTLKLNESGAYSEDQVSQEFSLAMASGSTLSFSWSEMGIETLDWDTEYAVEWRIVDAFGADSGWMGRSYFTTNRSPKRGTIIAPVSGTAFTGAPTIIFTVEDPDDTGGDAFEDPAALIFQREMHGGTATGLVDNPLQVAINLANDRLAVTDPGNTRLQFVNPDTFAYISHINIAAFGTCYDTAGFCYATAGQILYKFSTPLNITQWSPTIGGDPYLIATDDIYVYVAKFSGGSVDAHLCSTGAYNRSIGKGVLLQPISVAYGTNYVQVGDVLLNVGRIFVGDVANGIFAFDPVTDKLLFQIASKGWGAGQSQAPYGLYVHPITKELWVSDSSRMDIQRFTFDGEFVTSHYMRGAAASQWNTPRGIAINLAGDKLYLADLADRVKRYAIPGDDYDGSASSLSGQVEMSGVHDHYTAWLAGYGVQGATGWTVIWTFNQVDAEGRVLEIGTITAAPANTTTSVWIWYPGLAPVVEGYRYTWQATAARSTTQIRNRLSVEWTRADGSLIARTYGPWVEYTVNEYVDMEYSEMAPIGAVSARILLETGRTSTAAWTGTHTVKWTAPEMEEGVRFIHDATHIGGNTFSYVPTTGDNGDIDEVGKYSIRTRGEDVNTYGPWTEPTVITKVGGLTATITSPSPGEVLNTASPIVTWLITEGTQWRFRVQILDALTGVTVYDSSWVQNETARSHVVPPFYLNDDGSYVAQLWIDTGKMEVQI
jgi:hypothetical protein